MKLREFETLVRKLELQTRQNDHKFVWFEENGKVITRTKRSNTKGDLPHPHSIRQQLKLNEDQLSGILDCTLDRSDYIQILKAKKLIVDDAP